MPPRHSKRYATPIGLDRARFVVEDFTIGLDTDIKRIRKTNVKTGEMSRDVLYRKGGTGTVVEGWFAKHYNQQFQAWISGPTCLTIQTNLPKLLRPDNVQPVTSKAEFDRAIQRLEILLREAGIRADLFGARIKELEICRNVVTDSELPNYYPALDELTFPRTDREPYENRGRRWINRVRCLKIYDKGNEQDLDTDCTQRFEYSLTELDSVRRHLGPWTVSSLRDDFHAAERAFREAVERLIPEQTGQTEESSSVGPSAYESLLDSLEEKGHQNMSAVTAIAGAFLRDRGGLQPFLDTLRKKKGRQTANRYRKKFEEISPEIGLLRDGERPITDLKRELRSKLLA